MPRDNRIKVYRSTQGAAPPSFTSDSAVGPTFGEFAFSDGINSLFMGKDDGSLLWVGAQVTGGDIGQGLTTAVPTQKAVKDYVTSVSSGYWIVRDENGLTHQIDLTDTLTLTGGAGVDVLKSTDTDTLVIKGVTATTSTLGVASFSSNNFVVTDGQVVAKAINLFDGAGTPWSLSLGDTSYITGDGNITTTVTNIGGGTPVYRLTIGAPIATATKKGIASFSTTHFGVVDGAVSLTSGPMFTVRDEKQSSVSISWGDVLTLTGGPGINVFTDGATDRLAIQGITAAYTALGIASFKSGDFVVTSGAVSLTSGIVNSVNGLTGAVTVVSVLPLASTTGTTGVAAFNANYFSVSATGTVSLTTVDGGTWP